ncbi:MAG: beta-propeller fold lactonase family protein [Nitrososphaeraceae archaeon]|nr:beta-propeller fold lactonase family protein [Nitrososphaeraceae archaeon]
MISLSSFYFLILFAVINLALYSFSTHISSHYISAQENITINNNSGISSNSISVPGSINNTLENQEINNSISRMSSPSSSPSSAALSSSLESGINVNTYPVGITVNPSTKKVYVANEFSNTVSVVDIPSLKVEKSIGVENFPYAVDSNTLNNRVYVTNRGSNSVSVIDGSTDSILYNISVEQSPVGIAVNPTANWIYVSNLDSRSISVIDGITNTVQDTIRLSREGKAGLPYGIAVNPLTNRIYVTDLGSNSVHVIDGSSNKMVSNIQVGLKPVSIAVDVRSNTLYVANHDSDNISVIDGSTNQLIKNIPAAGDKPVGISLNSISNKLYVSNIGSETVTVLDVSESGNYKVLKNITVNPSTRSVYGEKTSVREMQANLDFPLIASFVAFDPTDNLAYLTNTASNTISVIDGETDSVAVRITFDAIPPEAGDIECNGIKRLSGNSTLYNKGELLQCAAIPERGYILGSWSGLANDLSSNPLTLETSEFGTLTANFKPALSPEAYVFMIGGVVGASSVFLGWYYKYGQRRYINRYMTRIQTTYDTLHEVEKEQCIIQLRSIKRELLYLFKKGSLSDSHYNILDKRASDYIESIRHGEEYL